MRQDVLVGGGAAMRPLCQHCSDIVRSLLPRMEQFGIATAEEVQVETLAERLEHEICAVECQVASVPVFAAWASKS
jgi:hypothetical protein